MGEGKPSEIMGQGGKARTLATAGGFGKDLCRRENHPEQLVPQWQQPASGDAAAVFCSAKGEKTKTGER